MAYKTPLEIAAVVIEQLRAENKKLRLEARDPLFRAGPDMLKALKHINEFSDRYDIGITALHYIRAAIAKAEPPN